MELVTTTNPKCSSCGASLEIEEGATTVTCEYCKSEILVRELPSDSHICIYCGHKNRLENDICVKCGNFVDGYSNAIYANLKNMFKRQKKEVTKTVIEKHVTINNYNNGELTSTEVISKASNQRNKVIALALCIWFGMFGAHKFYEGKTGMGILYIFTLGLLGIGWVADIISIALKPNPYYVD
jgi:restriction system protein